MVYSTRHRDTVLRTVRAHSGGAYLAGPLVVLVNEFGRQRGLALGGSFERPVSRGGRGRAKLRQGERANTPAAGPWQALKLTTALYYTPRGSTLQARGVAPRDGEPRLSCRFESTHRARERSRGHIGRAETDPSSARTAPPPTRTSTLALQRKVPRDPENGRTSPWALPIASRGDYGAQKR